jgi:hypothetical protein
VCLQMSCGNFAHFTGTEHQHRPSVKAVAEDAACQFNGCRADAMYSATNASVSTHFTAYFERLTCARI